MPRFRVIDVEFWIVILKLVMWMNISDISVTVIQIIQSFAELRPLKAELLLRQSSSSEVI